MSALYSFISLLAQVATPTPTPLSVEIIESQKEWWQQSWVVPAATLAAALVGGIGGVVIGGRMNRHTMITLENERAQRDAARDEAKAKRELAAERRIALASLRLILETVETARQQRALEAESGWVHLSEDHEIIPTLRPEDKHAVAAWVLDEDWSAITAGLAHIDGVRLSRASVRSEKPEVRVMLEDRERAAQDVQMYETLIDSLRAMIERLRAD